MKIKKILISQPKPELERSPYFEIAKNFGVEIEFRPFVQVEGIPAKEFRKHRVDILSYTAVIMTSKNAVDHFFRVCNEMRIIVPETMKYFCISETTAYYLQKYIQFRKRKIFFSNHSYADLVDIIRKKHKDDKFILPMSDAPNEEYTSLLDRDGIKYVKAPLYRAVFSDIKDINFSDYDMLVLFSSAGINSIYNSFPEYKQNETVIAAFGEQTAKAVTGAGLKLHVVAPQPNSPSMASAMDLYLRGEYVLSDNPFADVGKPKPKKPAKPTAPKVVVAPKVVEKPVAEKPVPAIMPPPKKAEPKAPLIKKPLPPVAKKAKPAAKKKEIKKPAPAPIKKKPASAKKKPVPQKSKPAAKKSKPIPAKKKPIVKKTKPAPAKKKPAPKKAKKAGKGKK